MTKQDSIDDSSAPLIEHLAELRNRILYSIAAFTAAGCAPTKPVSSAAAPIRAAELGCVGVRRSAAA